MRRRNLITVLAGRRGHRVRWLLLAMILVAGFAAHGVAAQVSGVPHVGLLHWPSPEMGRLAGGEFREGMRSLGWIEGSTISIEDRFADGNVARLSANAAEFVAAKVDVIVAIDSAPAGAAQQVTSVIPIVMTSGDPVDILGASRPKLAGISGACAIVAGEQSGAAVVGSAATRQLIRAEDGLRHTARQSAQMSSTAKNPSAGRTKSCPHTLASPGMSPRKSRTGGPASFKSTPPLLIAQSRASRRFRRFLPLFTRTLVGPPLNYAHVDRDQGDRYPVER
jgi:hypothetical protein